MSLLLALLYPLAVQYERGGWWRVLAPVTLFALVIDIIGNYTELALLTWDFPKRGEYTFSTRLKRLQYDLSWRGELAQSIVAYLNYFAPNGKHV
jgi:hypothetical protein